MPSIHDVSKTYGQPGGLAVLLWLEEWLSFLLSCLFTRFPTVTLPRLPRFNPARPPPHPLNLPLDLIALILSHHSPSPYGRLDIRESHRDRVQFYKTCALVHRSWTPLAEGFLAREVRLTRGVGRFASFLERGGREKVDGVRELVVDLGQDERRWLKGGEVGEVVRQCRQLESLSLLNAEMVMLEDLEKLPHLRRLHLNRTALSSLSSSTLPSLPQVTHLSLTRTSLTSSPIPSDPSTTFSHLFPSLTSLSLNDTDPRLAAFFPSLLHLSISTPIYRHWGPWLDPLPLPTYDTPPLSLLSLSSRTLDTLLSRTVEPHCHHQHQPLRTRELRITADPRELNNWRGDGSAERERHLLGLYRLVAALAPPETFASRSHRTTTGPLVWWRRKGEPDPWDGLERISLSASLALSPHFVEVLQLLVAVCEGRGVEVRYVEAELDESGSEERKRANGAAFREGFWEEVELMETRR